METPINKVELRNLLIDDFVELKKSMEESYQGLADLIWDKKEIGRISRWCSCWVSFVYNCR